MVLEHDILCCEEMKHEIIWVFGSSLFMDNYFLKAFEIKGKTE